MLRTPVLPSKDYMSLLYMLVSKGVQQSMLAFPRTDAMASRSGPTTRIKTASSEDRKVSKTLAMMSFR